jgi:hypothetical protein
MYSKEENKQTSMEILECKFNIPLDDNMFTERGMKK